MKTLIRPYDVTLIYAAYAKCKIHMPYAAYAKIQNTIFQEKGSQIQINNKTIIEFGSRIIKASVCVICLSLRLRQITQTSALIIPHILLDLIQ